MEEKNWGGIEGEGEKRMNEWRMKEEVRLMMRRQGGRGGEERRGEEEEEEEEVTMFGGEEKINVKRR